MLRVDPNKGIYGVAHGKNGTIVFVDQRNADIIYSLRQMGNNVVPTTKFVLMTYVPSNPTYTKFAGAGYCSPPFGNNGRYHTAHHCVGTCNDATGKRVTVFNSKRADGEVIEDTPFICCTGNWFNKLFCTIYKWLTGKLPVNKYDHAVVDIGNDAPEDPIMVLSAAPVTGEFALFSAVPGKENEITIGGKVIVGSYDYFDNTYKVWSGTIDSYGTFSVFISPTDWVLLELYQVTPEDPNIKIKPGYSGSNAFKA
ncbi:MAG: hypothetical protein JZD41_03670 [Thermoproteus sp.]|nr:hypothetical protein [Thermoproteus sp.]